LTEALPHAPRRATPPLAVVPELLQLGGGDVYGRLGGRALAGLGGAGSVYATRFEAELLCVEGVVGTMGEGEREGYTEGGACVALIGGGELRFRPLKGREAAERDCVFFLNVGSGW
jgi:hypothetical protein